MIRKVNIINQEFNIESQRLRWLKNKNTIYFLGIKVFEYSERYSETAVKTEAKTMGFK